MKVVSKMESYNWPESYTLKGITLSQGEKLLLNHLKDVKCVTSFLFSIRAKICSIYTRVCTYNYRSKLSCWQDNIGKLRVMYDRFR